ncbi:MAG: DnaJ domain-containing protein [Succinimonas sp.]|nr:DnaJ domain-containing protein [Succinimonas sp.]
MNSGNNNQDNGCGCGCGGLLLLIIVFATLPYGVGLILLGIMIVLAIAGIIKNAKITRSSYSSYGGYGSQSESAFDTDDTTITCAIMRLVGYVARGNAVITRDEINTAEAIIARLGPEHRQTFIRAFQTGKSKDYSPDEDLRLIYSVHGNNHAACVTVIAYLVLIALANGNISPEENRRICVVADGLGVSRSEVQDLIRELGGYRQGGQRGGSSYGGYDSSSSDYESALRLLGVSNNTPPEDITKAYKKLIRKYHPDLARGKGLPENMVTVYENKTKEINEAYDLIRKQRGF